MTSVYVLILNLKEINEDMSWLGLKTWKNRNKMAAWRPYLIVSRQKLTYTGKDTYFFLHLPVGQVGGQFHLPELKNHLPKLKSVFNWKKRWTEYITSSHHDFWNCLFRFDSYFLLASWDWHFFMLLVHWYQNQTDVGLFGDSPAWIIQATCVTEKADDIYLD